MLFDYYGSFLTEKQADIFDLFYNEDLSLSEIGDFLGITRQGVRDSLKRGEEILMNMENQIGISRKNNGIMRAANLLQDISNEFMFSNVSRAKLDEFNKIIGEIV